MSMGVLVKLVMRVAVLSREIRSGDDLSFTALVASHCSQNNDALKRSKQKGNSTTLFGGTITDRVVVTIDNAARFNARHKLLKITRNHGLAWSQSCAVFKIGRG